MRYRYRTAVLYGPWRETADAALGDAVRARLAFRHPEDCVVRWRVKGRIEESQPCRERKQAAPPPGPTPRRFGAASS